MLEYFKKFIYNPLSINKLFYNPLIIKKILFYKKYKSVYKPLNNIVNKNKIEPWAFIRAKNEINTIAMSLNSILPVIKKGVIGYNTSTDGTEEFILRFCEKNTGFIPFKYDYEVIPANSPKYLGNYDIKQRLDSYYNAVLDKIPIGEWFIKIDCDHLHDTNKLEKLLYLPERDDDCIFISRINMHINKNGAEVD